MTGCRSRRCDFSPLPHAGGVGRGLVLVPRYPVNMPSPRPPPAGGRGSKKMNDTLTPKAIVAALDEHIVGQDDAKRAVAVALRNRWRRQQLSPELRDEVTPKNILMIGPTGCGKTEISAAAGEARRRAVRQGRGDQVHRGRLCRPRRRADRPRPGRGSGAAGARAAPQCGQGRGRGSGDGAAARCADRQGLKRGDARQLPPALQRRQPWNRRGRDRGRRGAGDAVRDPRHGRANVRLQIDDGQSAWPGAQEAAQVESTRSLRAAERGRGRQAHRP